MDLSEEKDEEDQKDQTDVDFIQYNLLEKSIKRGVWGSALKKIRTNIFASKPKKQIRECKFKPEDDERRALILLPSKPDEWFTTVLSDASQLEHENIIRIYGRTYVHSVNGIVTEWAGSIDARKQKDRTYISVGLCCPIHLGACCFIPIPCRWRTYIGFGKCWIPIPCEFIEDDVRVFYPPSSTALAAPLGSKTLKEVIHDQSISYTLADILRWNTQILRALEYVNQSFPGKENERFRRYFNRVLCPQNMILDPTLETLKICALGLHKEIPDPMEFDPEEQEEFYCHQMHLPDVQRELTIQRKINYSYYWAPEVWNGDYRYEASDVYSFGVVLWQCITRVEPMIWPKKRYVFLDPIKFFGAVKTTPMFQQFINRCTIREPSEERLPITVIKTILENMTPAEKYQNWDLFKQDITSFWCDGNPYKDNYKAKELYYCQKLISLGSSAIEEEDKEQISTIFYYSSLKLLNLLGGGSFGQVWSAEYEGKKIAVKFQIEMQMYPFLQEFSVLNQMNHENIVKVIGQTEQDGVYAIVMEFIDGTTLYDIIHGTPKEYSLGDVLKWNYQAASALEYMHSFRFLHRDIKPDNMMIEKSYKRTLKIVDLGGAKKIENSMNLTRMGTDLYIAPEIENKDHYNEQCDVYSWTITFWECLTAERPQRPPDYRSKINQICSVKFLEIIEKCSSSNPSDRKSMFIIKKWLGDMLNNRKKFTDTDSTFRESRICVWNEQTDELYFFAKTVNSDPESEKSFRRLLTSAKTSIDEASRDYFLKVPWNSFKIIQDLADESGHLKLIKPDPGLVTYRGASQYLLESFVIRDKILKFSKDADEKYLKNEFSILSKLKHRNIVELFGYTHDNELNYFGIITEYMYGDTLQEVIASGRFNTENIVEWSLQSTRGLEYMHSQNILHCDIQPANIMVNYGQCQIIDFKHSRDLQYEHPKEAVGTGIYMAPEVRRYGTLTTKSDVYSWAVTFWELCKSHDTSNATIIAEIKQMESTDQWEEGYRYMIENEIENASDKFNQFIQECVKADPEKRWSLKDIATLLENMMQNHSKSNYQPDFDNVQDDMLVKDNICLWASKERRTDMPSKGNFFYASPDLSLDLLNWKDEEPKKKPKRDRRRSFFCC